MKTVLGDLGLTLNEEKTKVVDAQARELQFLGFTIVMRRGENRAGISSHRTVKEGAEAYHRSEIKQLTTERYSATPTEAVIQESQRSRQGMGELFLLRQL